MASPNWHPSALQRNRRGCNLIMMDRHRRGQMEAVGRVQSDYAERVSGDSKVAELGGQRQLAAAIEKALVDGKVSPELRGQVRAMMKVEGAKRIA